MLKYYYAVFAKYDEHLEEEILIPDTILVESDSPIVTSKDDNEALRIAKSLAEELGTPLVSLEDTEGLNLFER